MKRYAFLYNPAARAGKSKSKIAALQKYVETLPKADIFYSKSEGDISNQIKARITEYDIFVACGGDGTIREVASTLIDTEKTMGIIPMGSGNDLCKTLQIPIGLKESLEMLLYGKSTKIDVGQCNNFIFLNTLGFGFDGLTNRYALEMKNIHPFFRYAVAALKASLRQNRFKVRILKNEDGKPELKEAIMVTLANGRVEGGAFWIAPGASVTDGKLNFVTVRPIQKWLIPILLPLFLIRKPNLISQVEFAEIEDITLEFKDQTEIHADGELIENKSNKYSIRLMPNALHVICGL